MHSMEISVISDKDPDESLFPRIRAAAESLRKMRDLGEILWLDAHADRTLLDRIVSVAARLREKSGEIIISQSGEDLTHYRAAQKSLGDDWRERMAIVTDAASGALREEAARTGVAAFPMPAFTDERHHLFTAAGLLPAACSGTDLVPFLDGAADAQSRFDEGDPADHPAGRLAAIHHPEDPAKLSAASLSPARADDFGRGAALQTFLLAIAILGEL
jgi:glucose-6-phosphate isomerase